MPEISKFQGIRITMYFADHPPPHFHAECGDEEALVRIADGAILEGSLPRAKAKLVREWCETHRAELEGNWQMAEQNMTPLSKIAGL